MTNRSKRLRKKLKIDEFVELSFGIAIELADNLSEEQDDAFWHAFDLNAIDANGLLYGGLTTGVAFSDGGSSTDAQRELVAKWLAGRAEVTRYKVGPLVDSNPTSMRRARYEDFNFDESLKLPATPWVTRKQA